VTFGREVREELAHVRVERDCCRRAEVSAVLRFGGALRLDGGPGGGIGWVVETGSGAVARRVRAHLDALAGLRPEVEVHQAGNLRRASTYRLFVPPPAEPLLRELAVLDDDGRPVEGIAQPLVARGCDAAAYLRGALMAAGSLSEPRRDAHLEVRSPGETAARGLARMVRRLCGHDAGVGEHGEGWRLALKSGAAIGTLLARVGAHSGYLRWEDERLRRELRGDANRVANADRANVARSVVAASRHRAAAARALASPDWDDLPAELREVALARLANPEASLAELGGLLDPPVGKSVVHRRLARLAALSTEPDQA
jgi:DNA-binding protein WhiA